MATFSVWKFDSADGAENTLTTLERLQKEELIRVHDAAVVTWPEGRRKPKTKQLHGTTASGVPAAIGDFLILRAVRATAAAPRWR